LNPITDEIKESLVQFGENGELNGIVTHPRDEKTSQIGVILLNAGFLHKVGPNRIYVKIARGLSSIENCTVLRFDFSGIGDSPSSSSNQSHKNRKSSEIQASIDFICEKYNVPNIILIGFCSGADAAFDFLGKDNRTKGTILINGYLVDDDRIGEVYENARQNLQKRYYSSSIFKYKRLKRLFTGKSNYKAIIDFFAPKKSKRIEKNEGFKKWIEIKKNSANINICIILSSGSVSYDIYKLYLEKEMKKSVDPPKLEVEIIHNTDHLFTLTTTQNLLLNKIYRFINHMNSKEPHKISQV